jgi:hypothetical protein
VVKLEIPEGYNKSLGLGDVKSFLTIMPYGKSYEEYVKPGLLYFTEDLEDLAKELGVERIVPKGLFIMGIYGGEKKGGKEKYAGLVPEEYYEDNMWFRFRLWNTRDFLEVPKNLMSQYGVKVYKMAYVGNICPFKLDLVDILLSSHGEEKLKEFLRKVLDFYKGSISVETYNRVAKIN